MQPIIQNALGPRQRLLVSFCVVFVLAFFFFNPYRIRGPPEIVDPVTKHFSTPPRNTIVMAKVAGEDVTWVANELPDWDRAIYTVDSPQAALTVPQNIGREAMAYLTYLIDRYDSMPEFSVFLHAHRSGYPKAWHTDMYEHDNVLSVKMLRLEYVKQVGYVNLRCTWVPGCPDELQPFRQEAHRIAEHYSQAAFTYFFGGDNSTIPNHIGSACCSQFAVAREAILARPKESYIKYRRWLWESGLDDAITGRILEYFWHIIFGKDYIDCPDQEKCQCDVYGKC